MVKKMRRFYSLMHDSNLVSDAMKKRIFNRSSEVIDLDSEATDVASIDSSDYYEEISAHETDDSNKRQPTNTVHDRLYA